MYPEIESFSKWLRRKRQYTTTHRHYTGDLRLFFTWAGKSPAEITISDVDQDIAHAQEHGHAIATITACEACGRAQCILPVSPSSGACSTGQSGHSPATFHPPGMPLTPQCE
jgi:hypothetical protein